MDNSDDLALPPRAAQITRDYQATEQSSSTINGNTTAREIKKRNRIPVSCNECRRRKLRCDRKEPCSACVQRGDSQGCKFTEPLSSQSKSRTAKPGSRDFLQQRIYRLESLVTELATQVRQSNSPPSNTDSSQSPEQQLPLDHSDTSSHTSPGNTAEEIDQPIDDLKIAMGEMKISSTGKVTYTSGNSWNTILDEIADIKIALNPIYSSYHTEKSIAPQRPSSFPFFAVQTPSVTDLLALLPSRIDTELLTYKFFSILLPMCPCIHKPTFLKALAEFYAAPDAADPIFLGTLFAILASGISLYWNEGDTTRNTLLQKGVQSRKEMATIWKDASMQAFCLGGFLTNTSLENLQGLVVLHTFLTNFHMAFNLGWPLYGMIVSIALNMGLHRDGALFNLDPFETEMRRRVWSILVMLDGLNAASYGRPMMISDSQFDTKPLAQMNDNDFQPGHKLPAPPKDGERTDTTYSTCKYRLSILIRKIISSLFGLKPPSYETIMKFDAEIRECYESFPTVMKWSKGNREGDVTLSVQRLGLKVVESHALVILHRPFLHRSFRNPRYVPSREKCVEAAHVVLELFHEYRENLEYVEYSWYMLGMLHAFHAGTIVGLRCYLEPLSCSDRDWMAIEKARAEFAKLSQGDAWAKLGEKAVKVYNILIRKALEKKAILEGMGSNGVNLGAAGAFDSTTAPPNTSTTTAANFSGGLIGGMGYSTPSMNSSTSGSTGFTPLYSGSLFPTFDTALITNSTGSSDPIDPTSRLFGVGMPGLSTNDSSPEQNNWDQFLPKGTNLSEWDMFFQNMDIDFSNSDTSAYAPSNGSQPSGLIFEQPNLFGTPNTRTSWDFGNAMFGKGQE